MTPIRLMAVVLIAISAPGLARGQAAAPGQPTEAVVPAVPQADLLVELQERLNTCRTYGDDVVRLDCFDELTGRPASPSVPPRPATAAAAPQPAPGRYGALRRDADGAVSRSGNWMVLRSKDSMSDAPIVTLIVTGEKEIGGGAEDHDIFFRCTGTKLDAFIIPGGAYLGSGQGLAATYRLDGARPISERWSPSVNGTSAFAANPRDLLARIATASKALIEIRDWRGAPHRMVFDTAGIRDVAPAIDACTKPRPPTRR